MHFRSSSCLSEPFSLNNLTFTITKTVSSFYSGLKIIICSSVMDLFHYDWLTFVQNHCLILRGWSLNLAPWTFSALSNVMTRQTMLYLASYLFRSAVFFLFVFFLTVLKWIFPLEFYSKMFCLASDIHSLISYNTHSILTKKCV